MPSDGHRAAISLERVRAELNGALNSEVDEIQAFIDRGSGTELYAEMVRGVSTSIQGFTTSQEFLAKKVKAHNDELDARFATLEEKLDDRPEPGSITKILMSLDAWPRALVLTASLFFLAVIGAHFMDGMFAVFGVDTNASEGVEAVIDAVPLTGGSNGPE